MIDNIFSILIIALLSLGLAITASLSLVLRIKNTRLIAQSAQLVIDKQSILEELDRASFISQNSTDIENGFIKFLSESRDSAFEYIKDVQEAVSELKVAMESDNEEQIAMAYHKLITFLPLDSSDMVD